MRVFLIVATILIPFAAFADQPWQNKTALRVNWRSPPPARLPAQGTMAGSTVKGDGRGGQRRGVRQLDCGRHPWLGPRGSVLCQDRHPGAWWGRCVEPRR